MKLVSLAKQSVLGSVLLLGSVAMGAVPATTKTSSGWNTFKKNSSLDIYAEFTGPALGAIRFDQPSEKGPATGGAYAGYSRLRYRYSIVDKLKFFIEFPRIVYSINPEEPIALLDSRIGLSTGNILDSDTWSISFAGFLEPPSSPDSIKAGTKILSARAAANLGYSNGGLSLGLSSFLQGYAYTSTTHESKLFFVYFNPNLTYSFNSYFSLGVSYDITLDGLNDTTKSFLEYSGSNLDLQATIQAKSGKFAVTPFLRMFPSRQLSLDMTQIGAYMTATLF